MGEPDGGALNAASTPAVTVQEKLAAVREDPTEYSPEFQDEYRRLWHEAAADRDHYLEALRRIANNEFGDTFMSLEHVARVALQSKADRG